MAHKIALAASAFASGAIKPALALVAALCMTQIAGAVQVGDLSVVCSQLAAGELGFTGSSGCNEIRFIAYNRRSDADVPLRITVSSDNGTCVSASAVVPRGETKCVVLTCIPSNPAFAFGTMDNHAIITSGGKTEKLPILPASVSNSGKLYPQILCASPIPTGVLRDVITGHITSATNTSAVGFSHNSQPPGSHTSKLFPDLPIPVPAATKAANNSCEAEIKAWRAKYHPYSRNIKDMTFNLVSAEYDIKAWSPNHLAYSCFDAVILDSASARAMTAEVKNALQEYVKLGGLLFVLVDANEDYSDIARQVTSGFPGALPQAPYIPTSKAGALQRPMRYGNVALMRSGDAHSANLLKINEDDLCGMVRTSLMYFMLNGYSYISNPQYIYSSHRHTHDNSPIELMSHLSPSTPKTAWLILLGIFTVVAGPVLLWILARKNRRIHIFWIAPLISLATCGIILVFSVLEDGISPIRTAISFVELNQETKDAIAMSRIGVMCPMNRPSNLAFNIDTEVDMMLSPLAFNIAKTIHFQGGKQYLSGSWTSPRTLSGFHAKSLQKRQERLEFTENADGALNMVNGLGAPIDNVYYRRGDDIYALPKNAGKVPAGASFTLMKTGLDCIPDGDASKVSNAMLKCFKGKEFDTLVEGNQANAMVMYHIQELSDGEYLAFLDGTPFLEDIFDGKPHRDRITVSVVHGFAPTR